MSRHLSVRLDDDAFQRLDAESRRSRRTRSEIAKQLLEEGLRMEQHPGIVFRSGPCGRRPGLIGGPDVWEVVRGVVGGGAGEASARTGLRRDQVSTALRYYAEHEGEVDEWIRRVDDEAEQAETRWRREQELLGG